MSDSVDHRQESDDILRLQFCEWLLSNGAKFPKIKWPTNETESGSRGAIAIETIETGEHMVEIPMSLMMSPPNAFADPEVGEELRICENLLHGDLLITVFIMHELRKGDKSFFSPFLKILPEPGNISEWSDEQLLELQDKGIILRAKNRRQNMKTMYSKAIRTLNLRFPDKFPLEDFTYERFKFSWNSVQARAFGRRLPWTAMVPFADCLNHSNVQTKYDYNVNGNGAFRLFPTGSNRYPQGVEVFNSYGRRPNENLLMDYGFAILDNEWDEIEMCLSVPDQDPHFELRYNALFLVGFQPSRVFRIVPYELPFLAMMFLRIAMMDAETLRHIVDLLQEPRSYSNEKVEASATEEAAASAGPAAGPVDPPPARARTVRISEPEALPSTRSSTRQDARDWFGKIISAELETSVLTTLRGLLLSLLGNHDTSVAQDQALLARLEQLRRPDAVETHSAVDAKTELDDVATKDNVSSGALSASVEETLRGIVVDSDAYWRLLNSVTYRLTRKNILVASLRRLDQLIAYFEALQEHDHMLTARAGGEAAEESCSELWARCVRDVQEEESPLGAGGAAEDTARRTSGYDYKRKYRFYRLEATHPLQWPEFD